MNPSDKNELLNLIENAKEFDKTKNLTFLKNVILNYEKQKYHTSPGKFSFDKIKSIGETAYQRAIFSSNKASFENLGEVVWNDLELPVNFSKRSRRRCVDLIGTLKNDKLVLCELKFASEKSNSNNPIYTIIELLFYYFLIKENRAELDHHKVFHKNEGLISFKWSNFNKDSIFIVGANEKYWTYWLERYKNQIDKIDEWLKKLPIVVHFFSSNNYDFKEQKGNYEKYTPSILGKTNWKEIFVKGEK